MTDLVMVHHQGAGVPNNSYRFLDEAKYSGGIGVDSWRLVRSPAQSFQTGSTGRALQVCLSGNRMMHEVSDRDVELVGQLCARARELAWITPTVRVYFHGEHDDDSLCPGRFTYARRSELTVACQAPVAPPKVRPVYDPPLVFEPIVDDARAPSGAWLLAASGAVYTAGGAPFWGAAHGKPYFAGRKAARLDAVKVPRPDGSTVTGYRITAESGEQYTYPE